MSIRERKIRARYRKTHGERVSEGPYSFAVQADELARLVEHVRSAEPTKDQLDAGSKLQHKWFKDIAIALHGGIPVEIKPIDPFLGKDARSLLAIGSKQPAGAIRQSSVNALLNILIPHEDIHVLNERHEVRWKAKNCITTNNPLTLQPPAS